MILSRNLLLFSCCCVQKLDIGDQVLLWNKSGLCVVLNTCMKIMYCVETMESTFQPYSAQGSMGATCPL